MQLVRDGTVLTDSPDEGFMKPEKKPPVAAGWHGLAKLPMTTLWSPGKKWNSSTSPTAAVTELGLKEKPLWPTLILTVAAIAEEAAAAERRNVLSMMVRRTVGLRSGRCVKAGSGKVEGH